MAWEQSRPSTPPACACMRPEATRSRSTRSSPPCTRPASTCSPATKKPRSPASPSTSASVSRREPAAGDPAHRPDRNHVVLLPLRKELPQSLLYPLVFRVIRRRSHRIRLSQSDKLLERQQLLFHDLAPEQLSSRKK